MDNDEDGLFDFADPDEVSPRPASVAGRQWGVPAADAAHEWERTVLVEGTADTPPSSWAELEAHYRAPPMPFRAHLDGRRGTQYPKAPAVMYHVEDTLTQSQEHELWSFLRSDPQAWKRMAMETLWQEWDAGCRRLTVVEYYFYYINDFGLEGHEEDIEFAFLFLPTDTVGEPFQILVGAGHLPRTPNSVLVRRSDEPTGIIVELGGHASSPDILPLGSFNVGVDANWHAPDVWGPRDVLAVTGTGFFGRYDSDMTLPRVRSRTYAYRGRGRPGSGYSLIPVRAFARLDSALVTGMEPDEVLDRLRIIAAETPGGAPATLPDDIHQRLLDWTRPLCCGRRDASIDVARRQAWKHDHFRKRPTAILKEHLYRPSTNAISEFKDVLDLWTWSLTWVPEALGAVSGGLIIPVPGWMPAWIPGFLSAEVGYVHNGWRAGEPSGLLASLTHDSNYREHFGWYASLQWLSRRAVPASRQPTVSNAEEESQSVGPPKAFADSFEGSMGLSLLVWSWDQGRNWWVPVRSTRVRIGPRVRLGRWDSILDGASVELRVSLRQ